MTYYVYGKNLATGRVDFLHGFDTEREAVHYIALCYVRDKNCCQADENYYYMVPHQK